jgi:hypothetical protein
MTRHAKTEQDKIKEDKARQNLTGLVKKARASHFSFLGEGGGRH